MATHSPSLRSEISAEISREERQLESQSRIELYPLLPLTHVDSTARRSSSPSSPDFHTIGLTHPPSPPPPTHSAIGASLLPVASTSAAPSLSSLHPAGSALRTLSISPTPVPAIKPGHSQPFTYQLKRYHWRALLSISGPFLVLSFYAWVCFSQLNRSAENDIIAREVHNANYIFYAWFVLGVFILDWAKTAVANFEAAALMHPLLAPASTMQLFWHSDFNWANVIWWLRGIRQVFIRGPRSRSSPGGLWWLLVFNTVLLWIAIPLSGLTMEVTNGFAPGSRTATIFGPSPLFFNYKGLTDMPKQIRGNWRSGRPTTPGDASIFYAPKGTFNVSNTYYNDMIKSSNRTERIQIFAGPAVTEPVSGDAWGLEANITCRPVRKDDLRLISVSGFGDYSIYTAFVNNSTGSFAPATGDNAWIPDREIIKPLWINETGLYNLETVSSFIVATEGTHIEGSPYDTTSGFDNETIDALTRPETEATIALFEMYLWQAVDVQSNTTDPTMEGLLHNNSDLLTVDTFWYNYDDFNNVFAVSAVGFGVQCECQSAVGNATVDPATRTYSSFNRGIAATSIGAGEVYGIQVQAIESIGEWSWEFLNPSNDNGTLTIDYSYSLTPRDANSTDSTLLAANLAIGNLPYDTYSPNETFTSFLNTGNSIFPALTPDNLTLAIHRLLGEAVIETMSSGGQQPWNGQLYALDSAIYLRPGVIPWQFVLSLLTLWTVSIVSVSIWTLFTKRWSATLDGFEFFKFGGQYHDVIQDLDGNEFRECKVLAQKDMPGMVGMLYGNQARSDHFVIGPSVVAAQCNAGYGYDRANAQSRALPP
jgi:hypothetical protein